MAEEKRQPTPAQQRKSAEQQVDDARAALEAAQNELAEAQGELRAVVTRDVPQMVVEVAPDAHVVHEGKSYHGAKYGVRYDDDGRAQKDRLFHGEDHGSELVLDGPTAIALVMDGKVKIVRSL